jgi:predicted CoA-binding protein
MAKPTIAILGASADRTKFGNKAIRAYLQQGYDVFPVNPKGGEIEGLAVYKSLVEIPGHLNRVSVYLPPHIGLTALDDVVAKGCDELWLNPGSDGPEVIAKARDLGLEPIVACSIVDVGVRPRDLDE